MLDVISGIFAILFSIVAVPVSILLSCANRKPDVKPKKGTPMAPVPVSARSQHQSSMSLPPQTESSMMQSVSVQSVSAEPMPVKPVDKTQTLSVHSAKALQNNSGKSVAVKPVPSHHNHGSHRQTTDEDDDYSNISQVEDAANRSKHPIISIKRAPDGTFEQQVAPTAMATGH